MPFKTIAAALGAAVLFALPAYAFEIVTDSSGFAAPIFFADDPDGTATTPAAGNPFITSLGPYEYRTPDDTFDKSYSYSGYSFEDEKLSDTSVEAQIEAEQPIARLITPKAEPAKAKH